MDNYCGQCGNKIDECICEVNSYETKQKSKSFLSTTEIKEFFNLKFLFRKTWWNSFIIIFKNILTNPIQTLNSIKKNTFGNQIALLYLLLIFSPANIPIYTSFTI